MRLNIAEPEFDYDVTDPEGYRSGRFQLGPALGATATGASVYELPPGQSLCPYHYEQAEEEWLLVLAGRPSLRTPEGTEALAPWDVTFFPPGRDGAHKLSNETDETVRLMMWSEVRYPASTVYPDSGKIAIWNTDREDNLIALRSSAVDYYEGE
jgi:uncharacterized cupin superfamily protein